MYLKQLGTWERPIHIFINYRIYADLQFLICWSKKGVPHPGHIIMHSIKLLGSSASSSEGYCCIRRLMMIFILPSRNAFVNITCIFRWRPLSTKSEFSLQCSSVWYILQTLIISLSIYSLLSLGCRASNWASVWTEYIGIIKCV